MTDPKSSARLLAHGALLAALLVSAAALQGQTAGPYTPVSPLPLGDNLLSLPSSHIPAEGTWEIRFTHRFSQSLDQGSGSDRLHDLFGLDSSADVAIGLREAAAGGDIIVMGRPELTRLYATAIGVAGGNPFELGGEQSFIAGCARISELL